MAAYAFDEFANKVRDTGATAVPKLRDSTGPSQLYTFRGGVKGTAK
jgi:hypothetical protein